MSKKKDLIQDLVDEAQDDFTRREDSVGQKNEASLQSITEAARLAIGAKLAQFNVLDQKIQTTIVASGKKARRGVTLDIDKTFCKSVVQRKDDGITIINAHPALGILWPEDYQEGKGFYAGIGIVSPYDDSKKLGTLCVMDPGSAQDVLSPDGETGMGKEQHRTMSCLNWP